MTDTPVTLWRCPVCPVILVGPQIANTETHLNEHDQKFGNRKRQEGK